MANRAARDILDGQVERYLYSKVTSNYGLCLKFVSPGNAGVPDRIIIHRHRVLFVELKRPGEKPRPLQQGVARGMRKAGANVYCISTVDQVDKLMRELLDRTCYPCPDDYDPI